MAKVETFKEKMQALKVSSQPALRKTGEVMSRISRVLLETCRWLYKLRSIFLAIPVFFAAVSFAIHNQQCLPEYVGINLLATGEFAQMVGRSVAVMGPLAITMGCLVLMFCSRRVLYPWLISVFSLALPWLIYFINMYPA